MILAFSTACQTSRSVSNSTPISSGAKSKAIAKIIQITEDNICNPYWLEDTTWTNFVASIQSEEAQAMPWLSFIKHFNRAAKQLPFTHFYLYPVKPASTKKKAQPPFELISVTPQIAQLKVRSFAANASGMIQLIEQIKAKGYTKLIIDLRNNTGGTLDAAVVLGQFLRSESIDAGLYLSRRWFAENKEYPSAEALAQFPFLQDFTFAGFGKMLSKEKGFRMVIPAHQRATFKGDVVVLINRHTASTCEPLVHLLQQEKQATLIGEKTAGAMLSGRYFGINKEAKLFLPIADYMTGDGLRIDKIGVRPDVEVPADEALDYTVDTFFQQ